MQELIHSFNVLEKYVFVIACDICQRTKIKLLKNRTFTLLYLFLFLSGHFVLCHKIYAIRIWLFQIFVNCYMQNYQFCIIDANKNQTRTGCDSGSFIHFWSTNTFDSRQRFSIYRRSYSDHIESYWLSIENNKPIKLWQAK